MAASDFDEEGQPFDIYYLEALDLQEALEHEANEDEYYYYDYALARAKADYRAFLDEAQQNPPCIG